MTVWPPKSCISEGTYDKFQTRIKCLIFNIWAWYLHHACTLAHRLWIYNNIFIRTKFWHGFPPFSCYSRIRLSPAPRQKTHPWPTSPWSQSSPRHVFQPPWTLRAPSDDLTRVVYTPLPKTHPRQPWPQPSVELNDAIITGPPFYGSGSSRTH